MATEKLLDELVGLSADALALAYPQVVARYGWPLAPMAGAEEPDGDASTGADDGEADDDTSNEDETADGTPSGEVDADEVDDDFDRDRALETIRRQRAAEAAARKRAKEQDAQLKELQAKVREFEDAGRSEDERRSAAFKEAQEGRAAAESTAARAVAEAARLRVVIEKGLTGRRALALAKRLVGDNEDELSADADELLGEFDPDDKPDPKDVKRRPTERLKPGGVPDAEPEENDPAKLAGRVSNSW